MTDPAVALAARIERFGQAADPGLIWDPAALSEAEQAMRACAGDRSDAATWRLIGMLHLARYRLDQQTTQDAAVAGAFFAAVAVVDPGRLPEKLRGSKVPPGESAETWAGLVEEVFRHVDPATYRHVGLLIHALVRRAMAHPEPDVSDRLGQFLLQESMRAPDPAWAPGALGLLGAGLVRQYARGRDRDVIDDAVHVLLRAALGETAYAGDLASALGLAAPDDDELVRAYLAAVEAEAGTQERSRALLALVDLTRARAGASYLDGDLLAFIRVGQCALDFWHEQWAHPGVLAPYAAGLIEWFVVTGNDSSLEAGLEMLDALHVRPDEAARGVGTDPVIRLGLLGDRRWNRYGVSGELADLDTAIEILRQAADLATAGPGSRGPGPGGSGAGGPLEPGRSGAAGAGTGGHPDRARLLANLANALLRRAIVTGGDAAEPIAVARAALAAHDERDPARTRTLVLLARVLELDPTPTNADAAIAALREALAAGEPLDLMTEAYGLLSEVLCRRAARAGGERRAEDLREAVLSARQGVELAVKTSRDQKPAQRVLCRALLARYSAHGDPRDLTETLALTGDGDIGQLPELDPVLNALLGLVPAPGAEDVTSGPDPAPGIDPAANPEPVGTSAMGEQTGTEEQLVVDEQLALAATELALRSPDEDMALKLLQVAEQRAEAGGERGEFLLASALRLAEGGRPHTAAVVLERAASAFEAAGLRARAAYALSRLGSGQEESGEPERAMEAYARSAAIHHDLDEPRQEAYQLGRMGLIHLRTGAPALAVEHHVRAIALCEEAGLPDEEARHQDDAAEAYLAAGDPANAVTCAARARALYLALGESVAAAKALVPAARAAVDEDDLTASGERIAACAIELEAAGAWEEACAALDAHAVLLSGRGHPGQAAACETRLVEIVRRRGQRREPADEWYRIAQRRRGRSAVDGARVAFELAEREYEAIGHHDGAGAVRYNLGVLAYAEGELERALDAFGAAGEAFAGLRAQAKEAAALTMRAACLTALDRVEEALADLDRALELATAEGDLEALLIATLGRAALAVELGELQDARERLHAALGLTGGDALKQAVVRDRLAALAARTGDVRARTEALEAALTGFRDAGQERLAALASIKLGFALEASGEFRRARTALEGGLIALETAEDLPPAGAPFEVIAAMAGELDAAVLSRLAAIQLTLGDLHRGRATLTRAVTSLRTTGRNHEAAARLQAWLRLEEAEASGDLPTARTLAEHFLSLDQAGRDGLDQTRAGDLGRPERGDRTGGSDQAGGFGKAGEDSFGLADGGGPTGGSGQAGRDDRTGGFVAAGLAGSDPADRSYLLAKLSFHCRELGDLPAAYEHAAQGYELRDERVIEHLRNLGAAATALGRPDEAVTHLSRAVRLARDADSALPAQLVQSLGLLAAALTDLARTTEAARAYDEGLTLIEAPLWRVLRSPLLTGRATLHLKLGELDEAATRYRQAIALGEELGRRTDLASAYAGLGLVHELRGDLTKAHTLTERALDLERANNRPRGTVLALITLSHLEKGPTPAPAPPHAETSGGTPRAGNPGATWAGEPGAARAEESGAARAEGSGAAWAGEPGAARVEESGAGARAVERLEEALVLAREIDFRAGEAVALARLGALDLAADSHARATRHLSAAIELLSDLGHDLELATACHHRSIASEALGDLPGALADAERACALGHEASRDRAIRLAVHLNQGMTAWTHAEHAKLTTLSAHLNPPASPDLPAPQALDAPLAPQALPAAPPAPQVSSAPQVPPALRGVPVPRGVPADLLEAERSGIGAVGILMSAARNTRDPEHAAQLIQRAHAVQADLNTLWQRMEPLAPGHVALRRGAPPSRAQLDALVSVSGDGERDGGGTKALLGFHTGEDIVTVLAHRTGWPQPRAFPTTVGHALLADFLRTADGHRPGLLDIEARRHRADLWRRLADLLLSEALQAIGDDLDLLYLLPDAALHGFPLHALAPDGRALIERFPVAYAPSAAVLSRLAGQPRARGADSLVLAFTPDPAERQVVESEARDVAALLGTTPRTATSELLPGSWTVVHLACRAACDHADPFGSGIRLADGLLTARDLMIMRLDANLVLVTAHENELLPSSQPEEAREPGELNWPERRKEPRRPEEPGKKDRPAASGPPDRETAGPHERAMAGPHHGVTESPDYGITTSPHDGTATSQHDGVAALGYGLLHAGARSALLTLWPVSAEITRVLMHDLHTGLRSGIGPAQALRAAVLGLRELYGSAEPELWASYVLVGLPDDSPVHFVSGMSVTSTR